MLNLTAYGPTLEAFDRGLMAPIIAVIAAGIVLAGSSLATTFLLEGKKKAGIIAAAIATLTFVGGVVALILMYQHETAHDTAQTGAVREWLGEDYGIVVSAENTEDLISGDALVVAYRGRNVSVNLVEAQDGRLAILDANTRLLDGKK